MAIKLKSNRKHEIDISGSAGNAYSLMGQAQIFAKQLDMDGEAIVAEMMSDDYEHLIATFDKHFGTFVDLVR